MPELLFNNLDTPQSELISPSKNYFKLPLFLATFLAFILKCLFALVGAMMLNESSKIFDDMLFSKSTSDAALIVLAIFIIMIVLP